MTAQKNNPASSQNILLAIAPAVFLGNDNLFEQLERTILTPDNLFDNLALNATPNDSLPHPLSSFDQTASQFPLPSFYDFLTLTLSHLPYLGPQHLIALPHRFPLHPPPDDKNKNQYHLLSFQQQLAERFLNQQPAVNRCLQLILTGIIIRALTAIDPKSIINDSDRTAVARWRKQAVEELRPAILQRTPHRWFGRAHQLHHLAALHQQFARINLDIYDRVEESSVQSSEESSVQSSSRKKIKNILRDELPGKFWLQNKKIHYHLLELQTLPAKLSLPLPSPFLTMINLASLTHWLMNGAIDRPEDIVQATVTAWRQELTIALDKKIQTRLYDHYPLCNEVVEKIDNQLKSVRPLGIKIVKSSTKSSAKSSAKSPSTKSSTSSLQHQKQIAGNHVRPLLLHNNHFLLSMVGQSSGQGNVQSSGQSNDKNLGKNNNPTRPSFKFFTKTPQIPIFILPWQKSTLPSPTSSSLSSLSSGAGKNRNRIPQGNHHLMMSFDLFFKKKPFIESGVWLAPDPNKKKSLPLLARLPKIGQKKYQPSHYYVDNSLQLLDGNALPQKQLSDSMMWHYVSCQKILLPSGDMLRSKKKLKLDGDTTITIERQFFMPRGKSITPTHRDGEKTPRVYLKAEEKIIAPGGIDFILLLPLSPSIKAFGKSDSHIRELEQYWQGGIKETTQHRHGGVVIEPLIPSADQKDNLTDKIESLQEVFLQSPDKSGGRLVAQGATLSLTKGVFLNNFMEEPCQVIMLTGQTMPGNTTINWVLELVA